MSLLDAYHISWHSEIEYKEIYTCEQLPWRWSELMNINKTQSELEQYGDMGLHSIFWKEIKMF